MSDPTLRSVLARALDADLDEEEGLGLRDPLRYAAALVERDPALAAAERVLAAAPEMVSALETLTTLFEYEVPYVGGERQEAFDKARKTARRLLRAYRSAVEAR